MNDKDKITHKTVLKLRPLDFLYDSTFTIPTEKSFRKLTARAIGKISEKDIQPCFESMFSDVPRYPRIQYVYKTENIPMSWTSKTEESSQKGIAERNIVQYVTRSTSDVLNELRLEQLQQTPAHKVCINGIGEDPTSVAKNVPKKSARKIKPVHTRSTQTDYRDSETQTDVVITTFPILNDSNNAEISVLIPEGVGEVNILNEDRQINELQQKLSKSKRNLNAQIAITKQIQRIKWLTREKRIDYVNEIRMEFAENTLSQHKLQIQTTITQREQMWTQAQEKLKNQKLQSIRNKNERELRKICGRTPTMEYTSMLLEPF